MKKELLILSAVLTFLNIYGEENTEVIKLGKGDVYSKQKISESVRTSISASYVIGAKEIEKRKYTSLGEILTDLSGVSITSEIDMRGHGIGTSNLNTRPKLIIDGVSQNFSDMDKMSMTPVYSVNVKDIKKIEVIPGGGSVLYGDGTSSGVINIITKRNRGNRGRFEYRYGSYANQITDLNLGTSFKKIDFDISYRKNKTNGYDNSYRNNTDYFSGKLTYNLNKTDYFKFQYNLNREKNLSHEENIDIKRHYIWKKGNRKDRVDRKKDEILLKYYGKINEQNELDLLAFYQNIRYKIKGNSLIDDGERVENYAEYGDKKLGIKLKNKYFYGNNSNLIFGLGYVKDKMTKKLEDNSTEINKNKVIEQYTDISFNRDRWNTFALNTYKYNNFLFIQGLRYEEINYKGKMDKIKNGWNREKIKALSMDEKQKNWSGNLGINYLYSDTGNVYAKYERGFNSPSPIYKVDLVTKGGWHYAPNNLKGETTNTFEIGWNDYLLNSLISTDIYLSQNKDEIKWIYDRENSSFNVVNVGETRRYGFDLKLEQKFDKFTFREAYSYVNAKTIKDDNRNYYKKMKEKLGNTEGKYISYVSPHKFTFGVDYEVNKKLNLSFNGRYSSDYYLRDDNKKYGTKKKDGKNIVVNFRGNYKLVDSLDIYAGINNIFNSQVNNYANHGGNRKYFVVAPERNYYVGFSYKF